MLGWTMRHCRSGKNKVDGDETFHGNSDDCDLAGGGVPACIASTSGEMNPAPKARGELNGTKKISD